MVKPFMTVLFVGLLAVVILAVWVRWMEPRMIYQPTAELVATPAGPGWRFRGSPAPLGLVHERGCDPRRVVIHGESLGSAVAADLAASVEVGGLVLAFLVSAPDWRQALERFFATVAERAAMAD